MRGTNADQFAGTDFRYRAHDRLRPFNLGMKLERGGKKRRIEEPDVAAVGLNRRNRIRQPRQVSPLADKPFRQLVNPFAPLEVLSPEQLEQIHQASLAILENIGLEFMNDEVCAAWHKAGAAVDRQTRRVRRPRSPSTPAIRRTT